MVGTEFVQTRARLSWFDSRRMDDLIAKPANLIELLAIWRQEAPLGPDDDFPDIDDMPASPEDVF
jgi:hypothetical protein